MHVIEWDFLPRPERLDEFLAVYGEDGDWVRLFRRGTGYLGTELRPMADRPGWYRCIDRWRSAKDYAAFRADRAAEYAALDRACERLTQDEVPVAAGSRP